MVSASPWVEGAADRSCPRLPGGGQQHREVGSGPPFAGPVDSGHIPLIHGLLVGRMQGSPSILHFPTMTTPRAHHQGALCSCSEPADPEHTRWSPDPAPGLTGLSWAGQQVLPLRGQTQSPAPGLPLGVKLHSGPRTHNWRVMGSGRHQAPPSSPGAEEGRSSQSRPRAPLSSPQSPPAPPQRFPKSLRSLPSTLIHGFPPQSWAPFFLQPSTP